MLPYQTHRNLPNVPRGYPLAPTASWFSVVVPIARTNLVTNPSFETNTTNWTAIGGSIARTTAQQYHGAYSLSITPTAATTDGARFDTVSLSLGQLYAYSAKVLGVAGVKYKLCVETTGASELASVTFTATGRWQWVYGYYQETATNNRRITLRKANSTSTGVFYLDGVQVEAINAGEYVSTYIDGDQQGLVPNQFPAPYTWGGTPHASTSARTGQTRAGGMVMRLDYYGFVLLAMAGLLMPTPNNVSVPYVQLDGAQYERTQKPPRQFTLAGRWDAQNYAQLNRQISQLAAVLDRDQVGQQQPLALLYQGVDDCGRVFSDVGRIVCSYQGGLEGSIDSLHSESASLVFKQWLPSILSDGEAAASLTVQTTVANANQIIERQPSGTFRALGTGVSSIPVGGSVEGLARSGGTLYMVGLFNAVDGVANTKDIAQWNLTTRTWSAVGTGMTGANNIFDVQVAPNGNVWVFGNMTQMGGVANTGGVAFWDGSAWNGTVGGPGTIATVGAITADGTVYVGTTSGQMWRYAGTTWTNLGTPAAGVVSRMAVDISGNVYHAVGAGAGVYKWDGSSFTAVGSLGATTNAVAVDPATNVLYAAAGTGTYYWNGTAWTLIATVTGGSVWTIVPLKDSKLFLGGLFTGAGGVTYPDSAAYVKGTTITPFDIDMPGTAGVNYIRTALQLDDGTLFVGTNGPAGTAGPNPGITTVTNAGTAKAYPTVTINGPSSGTSQIYQLLNTTTGRSIYFKYTMAAGEIATLRFTPDNLSFTSNYRGNITSVIQPGSTPSDFFLQPGANTISFFAAAASVTAVMTWRPAYNTIMDLTP